MGWREHERMRKQAQMDRGERERCRPGGDKGKINGERSGNDRLTRVAEERVRGRRDGAVTEERRETK